MENKNISLERNLSLNDIQNYLRLMAQQRGFDKETPQDTLLVMLEECGELAKALRKHIGLKVDHKRLESYGQLSHEMADVLICLIILANKCNIDLYEALEQKEAINKQRIWQTDKP